MKTFVLRDPVQVKLMTAFLSANWAAAAQQSKPLSVQIVEYRVKRNNEQNKLLHAVLNEIAESAWVDGRQYDADKWKEFFKRRFIGVEEIPLPGGGNAEISISTTTLSVPEFAELIDRIIEYSATQLGVEIGNR